MKREARFEAATMFVESRTLQWLRDGIVAHTPLFDLFVQRRASER